MGRSVVGEGRLEPLVAVSLDASWGLVRRQQSVLYPMKQVVAHRSVPGSKSNPHRLLKQAWIHGSGVPVIHHRFMANERMVVAVKNDSSICAGP